MLQIYGCGDKGFAPLDIRVTEIPALSTQCGCLWVDLVDEKAEARSILEKIFGEGADSSEATMTTIRLLGTHTEATLVLLPRSVSEDADTLRILFNPKVLVTIRTSSSNALVEETVQSLRNLTASHPLDVDLIFSRLLEEVVDSNGSHIHELRDTIDRLEGKAVLEEEILGKVEHYGRKLGKTHDLLQGQRLIIENSLEGLLPDIGKTKTPRTILLRAERKLERQIDLIDHYDHQLVGVVNINNLTLTMKLTRIMTLLTVVSTVLLLPNTVATIFGIPSLPVPPQAWLLVMIIIIVSGMIPTLYLLRKRWLKL